MAAIALVSSSSPVDWWDGGPGSARKGTKARPASRRSRGAHTDPECLNKCQECGVPVTGWISVTAGGVEHETEHKGQLARAATRKPRVPARTEFPTPRPCAPPNFSVTVVVDRSRAVATLQIRLQSLENILSEDLSLLFTHSRTGTLLVRMGESCDWGHKLSETATRAVCAARDHPHAGNSLAQLGYEVNAVLNPPRF
jgi:hypothetical protein